MSDFGQQRRDAPATEYEQAQQINRQILRAQPATAGDVWDLRDEVRSLRNEIQKLCIALAKAQGRSLDGASGE